jgi:hypothetical protein
MDPVQRNQERLDNMLATGFFNSSAEAYIYIKNSDLSERMIKELLNYLKEEQLDEELELYLS